MTAEEVLELPLWGSINGYELVDGRPIPVMRASGIQRRLIVTAAYLLEKHVREHRLHGEVRSDAVFVLALPHDPERVRAPDVSYVERNPRDVNPDPERPDRLLRRAPDLAIEIDMTVVEAAFSRPGLARKPGGRHRIAEYLEAGTRLVWLIDSHTRTATVHRGDRSTQSVREDEPLDGEDVIPGLRVLLGDVLDL